MLSSLSCVWLFATLWTVAYQVPLSMGFSRQKFWSGLPCPPPGNLPNPGIKAESLALQAESLPLAPSGKSLKSLESESEVAQLCLTLCDYIDCSLPGSSVHGIFQAIVLEWIAISFSGGSSRPRDQTRVSRIVNRQLTAWATISLMGKLRCRREDHAQSHTAEPGFES